MYHEDPLDDSLDKLPDDIVKVTLEDCHGPAIETAKQRVREQRNKLRTQQVSLRNQTRIKPKVELEVG